jgi:hypothetical protein
MKLRITLAGAVLLLAGCAQLPRELRARIDNANENLAQAEKDFARINTEVLDDLKGVPALFRGTRVADEWPASLRAAKSKLDAAGRDREELKGLEHSSDREAVERAQRILAHQDHLRREAIDTANSVRAQATRWLDFQRNLPHYLARMREEHDAPHTADFAAVTTAVERAETDWPNKKADLDRRLSDLKSTPARADAQWQATTDARAAAANGSASGPQVAALMEASDSLDAAARVQSDAAALTGLSGQLYNSWDKVLEDLDVAHGEYREKVKIVKTHFIDVPAKKTEVSTDVRWDDISPSTYRTLENDLGMAIAHKDAGQYDSEAETTAQPAGFAYIAPPSVGSNQYGYWTHTSQGSFWTFLPQYLIMRELFWGNSYRPIVINEYNGYYAARSLGRTYYGQSTPAAPPRYGTHGTFTQQRYASSRYVQSGGFGSSAYASHRSAPTAAPPSNSPRFGNAPSDSSQGKRFGSPSGSRPAGKGFGSSHSSGKSFGRRR